MMLSAAQLGQLDEQGFLILPGLFSDAEVDVMRTRLPALFAEQHDANIVEQFSGVVRTSMGLHLRDEVFAR
ncbi:MAG: phytanoyl-CoA dioxygenase family protein, partial [Gammaproteobacteria bacterium]